MLCILIALLTGLPAFAVQEDDEATPNGAEASAEETLREEPRNSGNAEDDYSEDSIPDIRQLEQQEYAPDADSNPDVKEIISQEKPEQEQQSSNTLQIPDDCSCQTPTADISYTLKFSITGTNGDTAEFSGGSEDGIAVCDVLKALNIDFSENSVIGFVEDSVDTGVIGIRNTEKGLFILDNGHFEKASKPLILTVDGMEIAIDITDPRSWYVSSSGDDDTGAGTQGSPYKTINHTLTQVGSGDTIVLMTDISENITVKSGKNIVLDLNGHLLQTKDACQSVVKIEQSATLTLVDTSSGKSGNIKGWNCSSGGGVNNAGTFIMNGGSISGCTTNVEGSGVYNSGTFIMKNGKITGNIANTSGAGVYNESIGVFILENGEISNNSIASNAYGGGVYNAGTFTMNGGIICGNSITGMGGGVYSAVNSVFSFNGGEIYSNSGQLQNDGDNIYICQNAAFEMNGGIIFSDQRDNIAILTCSNNTVIRGGCIYTTIVNNGKISISGGKFGYSQSELDSFKNSDGTPYIADGCYSKPIHDVLKADYYLLSAVYRPEDQNCPGTIILYSAAETTDPDRSVITEISGTIAFVYAKDVSGNISDVSNISIVQPETILLYGAKTAKIRMTDKLMVVLDIVSAMQSSSQCKISVDFAGDIVRVACDGKVIFTADISDISAQGIRIEYDGKTARAYDIHGSFIKEFNIC